MGYHVIAQCEEGQVYLDPIYICRKCGMKTYYESEMFEHITECYKGEESDGAQDSM